MVETKGELLFELIQWLNFTNQIVTIEGRKFFGDELFAGYFYKVVSDRVPLEEWEKTETGRHLREYKEMLTEDDILNLVELVKGVEEDSLKDKSQNVSIHGYDLEEPINSRLESCLVFSGEASRQESFFDEGQSLLVVSDRVINWAIAVLAREKGGTEKAFTQIYGQLANQKEENQWHWLRQRLPDAAIESLIKKLEKENGE